MAIHWTMDVKVKTTLQAISYEKRWVLVSSSQETHTAGTQLSFLQHEAPRKITAPLPNTF